MYHWFLWAHFTWDILGFLDLDVHFLPQIWWGFISLNRFLIFFLPLLLLGLLQCVYWSAWNNKPLTFFFFIFLVPVWIISNVLSSGSLSLFTLYSSLLLNLSIEFFQISYFILQLHDFCLVLFTKFSWNFHFVHCSSELTEHFCEVFFEKILR